MFFEKPEAIQQITETFLKTRERWGEAALEGEDSLHIAEQLAASTDAFLLELWRGATSQAFFDATALLALGSYGRREMALESDIDLMIEVGRAQLLEDNDFHLAVERFMTWC